MRKLIAVTLCAPLSGCFFFYIPPGMMSSGPPLYCVTGSTWVGGRFNIGDKNYQVTKVRGDDASECAQQPEGRRRLVEANAVI